MPAENKTIPKPFEPLQGLSLAFGNAAERAAAMEKAFDYRGDVTLELKNGENCEGYLFNREETADPPRVEMLIKGSEDVRRIPYGKIVSITFSGRDPASGRSWQAWMSKRESERKAEAERIRKESEAMGHL